MQREFRDATICLSLVLVGAALWADSPARELQQRLRKVGDSDSFYWAWTDAWLDRCGATSGDKRYANVRGGECCPKSLDETMLQNGFRAKLGVAPIVAYTDVNAIISDRDDIRHRINRASLTAVIRKAWDEHRGVTVFTWHLGNPCASRTGLRKGDYRYKCPEHPNLVKSIVSGEVLTEKGGIQAGDDAPHLNWQSDPRTWYLGQLTVFADFLSTLKDRQGRRIPVIFRYPHEMDGTWFWWGKDSCAQDEFIRWCRLTADMLRSKGSDGQVLFAYTPDRCWRELGAPADGKLNYLSWYPGDDYVDLVGFDDYGIAKGKTEEEARANSAATLSRMRLVSSFAREHKKVAALTEVGCDGARDNFYSTIFRLMTADGVHFAFVNSWHSQWFMPQTEAGLADMKAFALKPSVLMLRP